MKVCVIASDLSTGGALTALSAADALADKHEVFILGPQFGAQLWPGLATTRHRIVAVPSARDATFVPKLPRLVRPLQVDVVFCCKPRFPSLFPALVARARWSVPVVLYVDDDELAMTAPGRDQPLWRRLSDPGGDLYTRFAHRMVRRADAVLCASTGLQRLYGGEVVPLPRDIGVPLPPTDDGAKLRAALGLAPTDFVIGFIGVPRAHKGIDVLLAAMAQSPSSAMRLLIVPPANYRDLAELREVAAESDGRVLLIEGRPTADVPIFLSACDAVAIPQRKTPEADAQIPAKLLEAMAMGKAIVATAVSDIPEYLVGCGLVIEPDRSEDLARALELLQRDPELRNRLGAAAREVFAARLSHAALAPRVQAQVERVAKLRR